jgi:hypothetical protein
MPTNKERSPNQDSRQNAMHQQGEKKQTSHTDNRSSDKSGMSRSDTQQKSRPSRDKDQHR